jgi:DNA polymerase elongation subunit (family B)
VGAGILLCVVFQDYESEEQTIFRVDNYRCKLGKEIPLLKDVIGHLDKYQMVVGHNVQRFDLNFLMTRCVRLGLSFSPNPFVYDTLKAFRRTGLLTVQNAFGKPSAGLDMVVDALDGVQMKSKIYPASWWESVWDSKGSRKQAMNCIVEHCQADVGMNAGIYPQLLAMDGKAIIKRWH